MNWFAEVLNWFNGLEWWVKLLIGLALLVAAVLLTILTGGGVTAAWSDVCSILTGFAFGVVSSVVLYTVMSVRSGEFSWGSSAEAFVDGVFWGGVFAFVSASVNAIKSACRSVAKKAKIGSKKAGTSDCTQLGQCFIAGMLVLTREEKIYRAVSIASKGARAGRL